MAGNADVKLLVGLDTQASHKLIDTDLQNLQKYIENKKIKVNVSLNENALKKSNLAQTIQNAIDKSTKSTVLHVTKIDATSALSNFKAQLQSIVNSISLKSGMSVLLDLPDMGSFVSTAGKATEAAKQLEQQMTPLQGHVDALKTELSGMSSTFNKLADDESAAGGAINDLRQRYTAARDAFSEYAAAVKQGSATEEQYQNVVNLCNEYHTLVTSIRDAAKTRRDEAAAAQEQQKAAENAEKVTSQSLNKTYSLLKQVTTAQQNWTKAKTGKSSLEYASLQTYANQLNDLITKLTEGTITKKEFDSQFNKINVGFKEAAQRINAAGEACVSFSDRLKHVTQTLSSYLSASYIITKVISSIRNMITATIDLDDTMTQLRIVTDATEAEYEQFGETVAKTAEKIGASISDLVDSTTVYARLGYSLSESQTLAEYTSMLSNVGDIDVSTAQNAITAITKAYGIGADEIEAVMDKMVIAGK